MDSKKLFAVAILCLALLTGIFIVITEKVTAAATLIVDDNGACPGATYFTIQSAVNAAAPGDTIQVCAGTYTETVTVNKTLTLLGAQNGVDARTRAAAPGTESVVNGAGGGFNITASNVVINGFTIEGASGPGIKSDGGQVLYNIIRNNTLGLYIDDNGFQNTIRFNLFDSNNGAGTNSGMGIYSDSGADAVIVDSNKFTGHNTASMSFDGGQIGANITNNQLVNDSSILLSLVTSPSITGNTITGSKSDAIRFINGIDGARLSCNTITNSAGSALKIGDPLSVGGVSTNLQYKDNNIQGNLFGLKLDPGAYTTPGGRLDATNNWWGSATGPNDLQGGNPGGTGDKIDDPDEVVDYVPFRTAPILDTDGDSTLDSCDADDDNDGTPDATDLCSLDPGKVAPGACGCGVPDTDTDSDGTPDCLDQCPTDPNKIAPGACGCGIPDTDTDADGVPNCNDNCPTTPNTDQGDFDHDGIGDACDPPENKDQCKNDEWQNFIFPRRFKNQGDCIQFVNTGK
ncbi:MAG: thrombospondin type 3 repeat-containing protein [Acidobacteria bacterium]|jgi:nitrous oxidase accessory protein NosD|nr:thrombospondin type 3 repeat-containing protein [Acidobacteriota bacterium]